MFPAESRTLNVTVLAPTFEQLNDDCETVREAIPAGAVLPPSRFAGVMEADEPFRVTV